MSMIKIGREDKDRAFVQHNNLSLEVRIDGDNLLIIAWEGELTITSHRETLILLPHMVLKPKLLE